MALSLAATPNPTTTPPSVTITLAGATGPTTLTRQAADGTKSPVRTVDGLPIPASTTSVVDYLPPLGEQLTYIGNGTVSSNPVVVNSVQPWLVHPGSPSSSVPIDLRSKSFEIRSRATARGVFQVIGRARPLVVSSGVRRSPESAITVRTSSLVEARRLGDLLSLDHVLFLNIPATLGLGVPSDYISIGDVEEVRISSIGTDPHRHWRLPYIVVDAPLGAAAGGGPGGGDGGTGTRTWADLALEAGTWAEAGALYATWADAATGNRI